MGFRKKQRQNVLHFSIYNDFRSDLQYIYIYIYAYMAYMPIARICLTRAKLSMQHDYVEYIKYLNQSKAKIGGLAYTNYSDGG